MQRISKRNHCHHRVEIVQMWGVYIDASTLITANMLSKIIKNKLDGTKTKRITLLMSRHPSNQFLFRGVVVERPSPNGRVTFDHCTFVMPNGADFVVSRYACINTMDEANLSLYPSALYERGRPREPLGCVRLEYLGKGFIRRCGWIRDVR